MDAAILENYVFHLCIPGYILSCSQCVILAIIQKATCLQITTSTKRICCLPLIELSHNVVTHSKVSIFVCTGQYSLEKRII